MLASNKLPVLGGETREVTVFFSDLAGFSSISERMTPADLVAFMNEYLSAMTDVIERHGGYVEKYIGDSSWRCSVRRPTTMTMPATRRVLRLTAARASVNSIRLPRPFRASRWHTEWG